MTAKRSLGSALRNLVTANVSSSLGDGIAKVAAPLLAARLTPDPLLVSGIVAMALLPWLLFAIPAGIILDRVDRRRAMAVANGVRALLSGALLGLYVTGGLTIWWLYAVVFVYGCLETIYDGALRAVMPAIVIRADLPRANSRIEAGEIVVERFLSAPLTSALFALSVVVPLGINVLSYAVAGGLALLLPAAAAGSHGGRAPDQEAVPWYRQLNAGLQYLLGHRMLRSLWALSVAIGLLFSAGTATLVLYVLHDLGLPEAWYGAFVLSGAVGSLSAATLTDRLRARYGTGKVMAVAQLVSLSALVLMGAVPTLWVVALGYLFSAGGTTVWNILVMSLRQAAIPAHLLGRVHGTWRTLLWGSMPLGALVGGLLGRLDLRAPLLIAGGAATLIALAAYRFLAGLPDPEDMEGRAAPADPQPQS